MTKVLFTGGRDKFAAWHILDQLRRDHDITIVVHGAARRGVDYDVGEWGKARGLDVRPYPAPFSAYGPIAGPMRNAQMLREERPDLVVAFPGGKGTADMVERAEQTGIEVVHV